MLTAEAQVQLFINTRNELSLFNNVLWYYQYQFMQISWHRFNGNDIKFF